MLLNSHQALRGVKKSLTDECIDSLYFISMLKSLSVGYLVPKLAMHAILQTNHLPISKGQIIQCLLNKNSNTDFILAILIIDCLFYKLN